MQLGIPQVTLTQFRPTFCKMGNQKNIGPKALNKYVLNTHGQDHSILFHNTVSIKTKKKEWF